MDGLLLDTERLSMRAWQAGARDFGINVPDSLFLEMIGHREADCIAILEKTFGAQIPGKAVAEAGGRHYQKILAAGVPLMRGAKELVSFLAAAGIPLAVATSTHRDIACAKLKKAGLAGFFRSVTGGDEVARGKPAPDIYLAACAALALSPADCVAFEDSSPGALSAAGAGLRVVIVPDLKPPAAAALAAAFRVCASLEEAQTLFDRI